MWQKRTRASFIGRNPMVVKSVFLPAALLLCLMAAPPAMGQEKAPGFTCPRGVVVVRSTTLEIVSAECAGASDWYVRDNDGTIIRFTSVNEAERHFAEQRRKVAAEEGRTASALAGLQAAMDKNAVHREEIARLEEQVRGLKGDLTASKRETAAANGEAVGAKARLAAVQASLTPPTRPLVGAPPAKAGGVPPTKPVVGSTPQPSVGSVPPMMESPPAAPPVPTGAAASPPAS